MRFPKPSKSGYFWWFPMVSYGFLNLNWYPKSSSRHSKPWCRDDAPGALDHHERRRVGGSRLRPAGRHAVAPLQGAKGWSLDSDQYVKGIRNIYICCINIYIYIYILIYIDIDKLTQIDTNCWYPEINVRDDQ